MSSNLLFPAPLQVPVSHAHLQPQGLSILPPVYLLCYPCYITRDTLPHQPTTQHHPRTHPQPSGSPLSQSDPRNDRQCARFVCILCPQCWNLPKLPGHLFCSIACSQSAAYLAPRLTRLPPYHQFYIEVARRFIKSWSSASLPNVLAVLMINWAETSRIRFEEYRNSVEAGRQFKRLRLFAGNEQKQFRGTKRACNLGEGGNIRPCLDPACWICETIRCGFGPHLERKRRVPFGGPSIRLGAGIYTTPVSSKADQYAENLHDPYSAIHAILVCRAVIGEPFVTTRENPLLRHPPEGYDCVCGKSGSGSQFTDDECVFYNEDAIRPAYLVVYERSNGH